MKMKEPINDVPLQEAVFAWSPHDAPFYAGKFIVFCKNSKNNWELCDNMQLQCTHGACWTMWKNLTPDQRLYKMYYIAWSAVRLDGINPQTVHEAFWVIPEYRETCF